MFLYISLFLYFEVIGGIERHVFLEHGLRVLVQIINIGLIIHLELHNDVFRALVGA